MHTYYGFGSLAFRRDRMLKPATTFAYSLTPLKELCQMPSITFPIILHSHEREKKKPKIFRMRTYDSKCLYSKHRESWKPKKKKSEEGLIQDP